MAKPTDAELIEARAAIYRSAQARVRNILAYYTPLSLERNTAHFLAGALAQELIDNGLTVDFIIETAREIEAKATPPRQPSMLERMKAWFNKS